MLRAKTAMSPASAFTQGRWAPVLGDPHPQPADAVRRVILCSGKVAWALSDERAKRNVTDTAIVRVEQLYPLPGSEIAAAVAEYPNAGEILWVQEEPANMGAWTHIAMQLPAQLGRQIMRISRPESSSPATGSHTRSEQEQHQLLAAVFPE
jgi:2-oxoglutarate dehydrogenase E1 component